MGTQLLLDFLREAWRQTVQVEFGHLDFVSIAQFDDDVVLQHVYDGLCIVLRDITEVHDLTSTLPFKQSSVGESHLPIPHLTVVYLGIRGRDGILSYYLT